MAEATPADNDVAQLPADYEELRIALVMNGGVSLAVWMGGVAMEINRLVRHDPYRTPPQGRQPDPLAAAVYGGMLGLIGSRPRVDVVGGASAGGLNGALLATALVHDRDLAPLRQLWLQHGDIGRLIRSPRETNPRSILEGDTYFLPRLQEAFASVSEGRRLPPDEVPVRLIMTTTVITGRIRTIVDELGSSLPDQVFKGEFHFSRGAGVEDDFQRDDVVDRLALAGRSTASFPGAFEASFVPVHAEAATEDPRRPSMAGTADFEVDRYVMDGGALVNKPIKPVMRAIFAQPAAGRPVRRVLAYVVPDPGVFAADTNERIADAPSMRGVVSAVSSVPKAQSISADIDDIREHNRAARSQQQIRAALLEAAQAQGSLGDLVSSLFPTYRSLRAADVVTTITSYLKPGKDVEQGITERVWAAIRAVVATGATPWLPLGSDTPPGTAGWPFGAGAVEHACITVLDLLNRGLSVGAAGPAAAQSTAQLLGPIRSSLHDVLARVRDARTAEGERWQQEADALVATAWAREADRRESRLAAVVDAWLVRRPSPLDQTGTGGLVDEAVAILVGALPLLEDVATSAAEPPAAAPGQPAAALLAMVRGLQSGGVASPETCRERLAYLGIVQYTLAAGMPVVEQQAQFAVLSAYTANSIDPPDSARRSVKGKVAGIQLSHFGAFYKRSWRANDWMWGRVDASTRLCQLTLNPARLRSEVARWAPAGASADAYCLERIERIVLPQPGDSDYDARPLLEEKWSSERADALAELEFVTNADAQAPPILEVSARAIARRLQLDIARNEVPSVAEAVDYDTTMGAALQPATRDFRDAVSRARPAGTGAPLTPDQGWELFRSCKVGAETIRADVGSDLFIRTSSSAAAVGANAVAGEGSGLKFAQPVTRTFQQATMLMYLVTQSAVSKKRGGFALLMFLLALGGALIAAAILSPSLSRVPLYVGLVLVAAGIIVAGLRAGALRLAILVVVWIGLAAGAFVWATHLSDAHSGWAWLPVVAFVAVLVAGAMLLGLVRGRPQTKAAASDDR
jgi:patatin-related protein